MTEAGVADQKTTIEIFEDSGRTISLNAGPTKNQRRASHSLYLGIFKFAPFSVSLFDITQRSLLTSAENSTSWGEAKTRFSKTKCFAASKPFHVVTD